MGARRGEASLKRLGDIGGQLLTKYVFEIEHYVEALKRPTPPPTSTSHISAFGGNVGAIVTGHGSVAHVHQEWNTESRGGGAWALDFSPSF